MKRFAAIGSVVFFFAAPCVVTGYVPYRISGWAIHGPGWTRYASAAIIAVALGVLIDAFRRFAVEGLGTPAPIAPTRTLVASGWYRYVRNPMYLAVLALILGQALLFASRPLLTYAAAVWLGFHLFVLFYEEPKLAATYGEQYEGYKRKVPRWIPLLRVRLNR